MANTSKKQIIPVSTKTGDAGESGLANGKRLAKHSLVFTVLGDLDELNSWIGLVAAQMSDYNQFHDQQHQLFSIQDDLFYLGAEVAASSTAQLEVSALNRLEKESEKLQQQMADGWTTQFLLPGGSVLGGYCDLARAVCRRAERSMSAYGSEQTITPLARQYINRLSDYLYVLRCYINQRLTVSEKKFIRKE